MFPDIATSTGDDCSHAPSSIMTDGTIAAGLPELMLGACGVVSAPSKTTVTVKTNVATFPARSLRVQANVVLPTGNQPPVDSH